MGDAEYERDRTADMQHDAMLNDVADIAARFLGCPIAVISLMDNHRIWLTSRPEIARGVALSGIAVMQDDPWVVEHASVDPRTLSNPLIAGTFGLRFYAGVPLRSVEGDDLGTLAVMDRAPRTISDDQLAMLKRLAGIAVHVLEMRLQLRIAARAA